MNKNKTNLSIVNNAGVRVKPNIIIGELGSFQSGDILDANAVEKLIIDKVNEIVNGTEEQDDSRLIVTYNVENESDPTQLYIYVSEFPTPVVGAVMFDKVEIDGVEVAVEDLDTNQGAYNFSVGEHTVAYTIKDQTFIGLEGNIETGEFTRVGATFITCNNVTSVVIPNSVTSIGVYAFYSCTGLTAVTIPNSVTSIGDYAFTNCNGLTSIKVESGNAVYDSRNNCNAIIETATNKLITGCKNTVIPNSVISIEESAFNYCTGLTSITIPNSVTSIGGAAFWGCSGLTSVTIGNSVTSIGIAAFYECSGLTSVHIADLAAWCKISFDQFDSNPLTHAHHLYIGENEITDLVIPNSVTSIGDYAFSGCSGLTAVTIPNSVTSIGGLAFSDCSGLTSITIEATTPPTVGNEVFNGTNNCPIYVPAESVDAYKTAWSQYADRTQPIQ